MMRHDSFARSLVMCWPGEAVSALEWAGYIRSVPAGPASSVLSDMAALIEAVYGKWPEASEPIWLLMSPVLLKFFAYLSPDMQPIKLGWSAQVNKATDELPRNVTATSTAGSASRIIGYRKAEGRPLVTLLRHEFGNGQMVTQIDEFPDEAALVMAWAILTNRLSDRRQLAQFREWYIFHSD